MRKSVVNFIADGKHAAKIKRCNYKAGWKNFYKPYGGAMRLEIVWEIETDTEIRHASDYISLKSSRIADQKEDLYADLLRAYGVDISWNLPDSDEMMSIEKALEHLYAILKDALNDGLEIRGVIDVKNNFANLTSILKPEKKDAA